MYLLHYVLYLFPGLEPEKEDDDDDQSPGGYTSTGSDEDRGTLLYNQLCDLSDSSEVDELLDLYDSTTDKGKIFMNQI